MLVATMVGAVVHEMRFGAAAYRGDAGASLSTRNGSVDDWHATTVA